MKRKTLRERAEEAMPKVWRGSIAKGGWQAADDGFVSGWLAGYRAGKREGKKEAMKACGWSNISDDP